MNQFSKEGNFPRPRPGGRIPDSPGERTIAYRKTEIEGGQSIKKLQPHNSLIIVTGKDRYSIEVLNPESGEVIIEGGVQFIKPVHVRIIGSRFLASDKLGRDYISIGAGLEIELKPGEVMTTPAITKINLIEFETNPKLVSAQK